MSLLFLAVERTGCFAITDQLTVAQAASAAQGASTGRVPFAYHLGVRLGLWRACLIILTQDFICSDDLCTMSLVICYHLG